MKGFVKLGDSTIINDVRENLISFFDYHLLTAGNQVVIATGDSSFSYFADPRYSAGSVWIAPHANFVWETGVGATVVSGIYVNNVFRPLTESGAYAYYLDHVNGRVVFNSGITTTSSVSANYSYKYISVEKADGLNWFKQFIPLDDTSSEILPENKVTSPTIGIELTGRKLTPYQLGGGQTVKTDFLIHCVSEDPYLKDTLVDAVSYQQHTSFHMYDLNMIADSGAFPLDYRNVPKSGALSFPNLVSTYCGRLLYINAVNLDSSYTLGRFHIGTVRISTEVIHFGV